jgi:hypothetical protein
MKVTLMVNFIACIQNSGLECLFQAVFSLAMRSLRRIKNTESPATYHAMSRIVGGQMLLGDREKKFKGHPHI